MEYYLAPMEALTGYIFRNILQEMFGGVDKYFSPFITAATKRIMRSREQKDVAPENNTGIRLVPQILAGNAEQFLRVAETLVSMGYRELNLNAGCPSGTVTAKGKGSGLLRDPFVLDRLLKDIFEQTEMLQEQYGETIRISVKTRIGVESVSEWEDILKVYNSYPLYELIIHPRLQKQLYQGEPVTEAFAEAYRSSVNPVIYNGDIRSTEDVERIARDYPKTKAVMIGRGAIADPSVFRKLHGGEGLRKEEIRLFHDRLYQEYCREIGNDRDAVNKMKEIWSYLGIQFPDAGRRLLEIKKSKGGEEYLSEIKRLFA